MVQTDSPDVKDAKSKGWTRQSGCLDFTVQVLDSREPALKVSTLVNLAGQPSLLSALTAWHVRFPRCRPAGELRYGYETTGWLSVFSGSFHS